MVPALVPACIRESTLCMTTSENKSRKGTMYLKSKMKDNIHNIGNIPAQLYTDVILVLPNKGKMKKSKINGILNDDFIISCHIK